MTPSSAGWPRGADFVVLGLGNPGERYGLTRHNLGFRLVDALAARDGGSFRRGWGPFDICPFTDRGASGILAKPITYMNRSGVAARALLERFPELALPRFLVVTDDLDLPLGRIRFRRSGGAGGHNGLRSIIREVGSEGFPRLRLGIGRPDEDGTDDVVDHVLEPFEPDEMKMVNDVVERAQTGVGVFLEDGIEAAMNRFNAQ